MSGGARQGVVVEEVGVPDLEVLSDGRLVFYYPGDAGRRDFCSVSRDGYRWIPGNRTIKGIRSLELLYPPRLSGLKEAIECTSPAATCARWSGRTSPLT